MGEPQTAVWFSAILISAGSVAGMDELDRTAAARLREVGQRYTGGRAALVELLAASDRPLTIPEILRARSGMPQSSVYRNLTVLEEAGLVQRVASSDEWARF